MIQCIEQQLNTDSQITTHHINDHDLQVTYLSLIHHFESLGFKYVHKKPKKKSAKPHHRVIDHEGIMYLINMKFNFIKQQPKCYKLVKKYINNPKHSLMFNKLKQQCQHSLNDQKSFISYILLALQTPRNPFKGNNNLNDLLSHIEWMECVTTKSVYSICYECINNTFRQNYGNIRIIWINNL